MVEVLWVKLARYSVRSQQGRDWIRVLKGLDGAGLLTVTSALEKRNVGSESIDSLDLQCRLFPKPTSGEIVRVAYCHGSVEDVKLVPEAARFAVRVPILLVPRD